MWKLVLSQREYDWMRPLLVVKATLLEFPRGGRIKIIGERSTSWRGLRKPMSYQYQLLYHCLPQLTCACRFLNLCEWIIRPWEWICISRRSILNVSLFAAGDTGRWSQTHCPQGCLQSLQCSTTFMVVSSTESRCFDSRCLDLTRCFANKLIHCAACHALVPRGRTRAANYRTPDTGLHSTCQDAYNAPPVGHTHSRAVYML